MTMMNTKIEYKTEIEGCRLITFDKIFQPPMKVSTQNLGPIVRFSTRR